MNIYQVNLQRNLGGGEVYTAFLTRAFDRLGVATQLLVRSDADFWRDFHLPASTKLLPVKGSISDAFPKRGGWVIDHSGLGKDLIRDLAKRGNFVTSIAHMPSQGRSGNVYANYDYVFGVSDYVVRGLRERGVTVWEQPLYGVAELSRCGENQPIRKTSCYDWDLRKGRDRICGLLEPLVAPFLPRPIFEKRPGITLGIVSRMTPIKQFPQLFGMLAPILVRHPQFNLELFGSGGYASVRDLKKALAPLGARVRWWGQQTDVKAVYGQLDYLMTGLPEKEALGLNVIEAQALGVPALAVDGAPFDETVAHELTGLRYPDPRQDQGVGFEEILERLEKRPMSIDMSDPAVLAHLEKFSPAAFDQRLSQIVRHMGELCLPDSQADF